MTMPRIERRERLDFGYELFIAAISILAVLNSIITYLPNLDPDAVNVVSIINSVLTLIFIYDFGLRIVTAPDRSFYFLRDYGWADLLAIIPQFRIFRLFRIFKAYRLVHKYGTRHILTYLAHNRAQSALYILVLMVTLIIESGAVLVLQAERASPDANILTAVDAIWWAYVTITTVGYGDRFPVTTPGRMVGIMVLTTGVAVFATFAGLISSRLLGPAEDEKAAPSESPAGQDPAAVCLAEVNRLLAERERVDTEIAARLERLERLLEAGPSEAVEPDRRTG
jgi:voltage-gated potassium channel